MEYPIIVRGHFKDTVERYDIETLFIIIERYVKLYIFDCVEIVHDRDTGPHSAVGNVSGYRCVSDCRSRGREFDPGPVPYFRED